jgi:hypothetical protein
MIGVVHGKEDKMLPEQPLHKRTSIPRGVGFTRQRFSTKNVLRGPVTMDHDLDISNKSGGYRENVTQALSSHLSHFAPVAVAAEVAGAGAAVVVVTVVVAVAAAVVFADLQ